jgi:hypothetical protein
LAEFTPENKNHPDYYQTKDGKIEIDSSAANILGSAYYDNMDFTKENTDIFGEYMTKADFYLSKRITYGKDIGCDICVILIKMNDGSNFNIYLPYNPLEDTHGNEIEMTNCPFAEINENGNILLLFGESSKSPKRIDDNYADLIIGWEDFYPAKKKPPKALKVRIRGIENSDRTGRVPRLFITFDLLNKQFDYDYTELIFEDYDCLSYDLHSYSFDKCEFKMSRLLNGRIYVKSDRFKFSFECGSIREYDNYRARNKKPTESDEAYIKTLGLTPDRTEMKSIAQNRSVTNGETTLFSAIFNAINSLRESKISMDYFKYWLQFYSEALLDRKVRFSECGEFAVGLSELLDKLYVDLAYDDAITTNAANKLDKFEKEVIEIQKRPK